MTTCFEPSCGRRHLPGFSFCRQHKCKNDGCNLKRARGLSYCYSHRCYYPSCEKPSRSGIFACSFHKCTLSTCNSTRERHRQHCVAHICPMRGCNRPRGSHSEGCESHTCQSSGAYNNSTCNKLVQKTPGATSCAEHSCGQCPRAYTSIYIPFCSHHRCQWTLDPCEQGAEQPSPFCEQHKCPIHGCKQSCRAAGMYCDRHRCYYGDGDCPEPNTQLRGSWHCQSHTCPVHKCVQGKLVDGEQCDTHTCVWGAAGVRCVQEKYGGDFCTQHRCMEPNCCSPRDGDGEGAYCAQHVCAADDCYDRRSTSGGRYCEAHRAEYRPRHTTAMVTAGTGGAVQNQETNGYGHAFLDGYMVGVNVQPADRGYAQRFMDENWQMPRAMESVTSLFTQSQMQVEGTSVAASSSSTRQQRRQPRAIEEAGVQQTLGDLIPDMNTLNLNQESS